MAPVIRDLTECRGYLETQGLKGIEKKPIRAGSLIGVEGFEGSLGS